MIFISLISVSLALNSKNRSSIKNINITPLYKTSPYFPSLYFSNPAKIPISCQNAIPKNNRRVDNIEVDFANAEYFLNLHVELSGVYSIFKKLNLDLIDEFFASDNTINANVESAYRIFSIFDEIHRLSQLEDVSEKSLEIANFLDWNNRADALNFRRNKVKQCFYDLYKMSVSIEDMVRLLIETLYFPLNKQLSGMFTRYYFKSTVPNGIESGHPRRLTTREHEHLSQIASFWTSDSEKMKKNKYFNLEGEALSIVNMDSILVKWVLSSKYPQLQINELFNVSKHKISLLFENSLPYPQYTYEQTSKMSSAPSLPKLSELELVSQLSTGDVQIDYCELLTSILFALSIKDEEYKVELPSIELIIQSIHRSTTNLSRNEMVKIIFAIYYAVDYQSGYLDWSKIDLNLNKFEESGPHVFDLIDEKCTPLYRAKIDDYMEYIYEKHRSEYLEKANYFVEKFLSCDFYERFAQGVPCENYTEEDFDKHVEYVIKSQIYQDHIFREYILYPVDWYISALDFIKPPKNVEKIYEENRYDEMRENLFENLDNFYMLYRGIKYQNQGRYQLRISSIILSWLTHEESVVNVQNMALYHPFSGMNTLLLTRGLEWYMHFVLKRGIDEYDNNSDKTEDRDFLDELTDRFLGNLNTGVFFNSMGLSRLGSTEFSEEEIIRGNGVSLLVGYIYAFGNILDPRNFPIFDDDMLNVQANSGVDQIGNYHKLEGTSHYVNLIIPSPTILSSTSSYIAETPVRLEDVPLRQSSQFSSNSDIDSEVSSKNSSGKQISSVSEEYDRPEKLPMSKSDLAINYLLRQYDLKHYSHYSGVYVIQQLKGICQRDELLEKWFKSHSLSDDLNLGFLKFRAACDHILKFGTSRFFAIYDERLFAIRRYRISTQIKHQMKVHEEMEEAARLAEIEAEKQRLILEKRLERERVEKREGYQSKLESPELFISHTDYFKETPSGEETKNSLQIHKKPRALTERLEEPSSAIKMKKLDMNDNSDYKPRKKDKVTILELHREDEDERDAGAGGCLNCFK